MFVLPYWSFLTKLFGKLLQRQESCLIIFIFIPNISNITKQAAQSCPTLCASHDMQPTRLLPPWYSSKSTGVATTFQDLLQPRINPWLPHCRQMRIPLSHQGASISEWPYKWISSLNIWRSSVEKLYVISTKCLAKGETKKGEKEGRERMCVYFPDWNNRVWILMKLNQNRLCVYWTGVRQKIHVRLVTK